MPLAARSHVLAGIGMMVFGIFLFAVNDTVGKWLVATYTVGQVLLIRSLFALAVLAPFVHREGVGPWRDAPNPRLQLIRVVLSTAEVAFFYWAVTYLPLADVMTYYLAGPIYVAALSAVMLGERLDRFRWAAVVVGFLGVLIALNPSTATLTWPALIALLGSLFFAGMMVTTRKLRGTSDTVLVTAQMVAALVLGVVLAPIGWVTPTATDFVLLGLLGVVALVAHACVNRSLKLAPASVVVPYQYTLIVWAILFGWLVFGDVPSANMLMGAALIVAAGLAIFLRERAVAAQS
jgi:drug/metabolite transporter (DMT)-like permease